MHKIFLKIQYYKQYTSFAPRGDEKNKVIFVKGPGKSSAKKGPRNLLQKNGDYFVFWGVGGVPSPRKLSKTTTGSVGIYPEE